MKSSSPTTKKTKTRSTSPARDAMKSAFRQLSARYEKENQAIRARRRAEKYSQWLGAAKRFKGLSEALQLRIACRNIQTQPDGYTVSFMRNGETFSRSFAGATEESLSAAIRFRDEALEILGESFSEIPERVLKSLGLSAPVPGISRSTGKSLYSVQDAKLQKRRSFSFTYLPEEDAYAAAIECLEAGVKVDRKG